MLRCYRFRRRYLFEVGSFTDFALTDTGAKLLRFIRPRTVGTKNYVDFSKPTNRETRLPIRLMPCNRKSYASRYVFASVEREWIAGERTFRGWGASSLRCFMGAIKLGRRLQTATDTHGPFGESLRRALFRLSRKPFYNNHGPAMVHTAYRHNLRHLSAVSISHFSPEVPTNEAVSFPVTSVKAPSRALLSYTESLFHRSIYPSRKPTPTPRDQQRVSRSYLQSRKGGKKKRKLVGSMQFSFFLLYFRARLRTASLTSGPVPLCRIQMRIFSSSNTPKTSSSLPVRCCFFFFFSAQSSFFFVNSV